MKTSIKLVLLTVLILLGFMTAYNLELKALYFSKSHLDPYRDFTALDFKGFDAIDVVSSGVANVKIIQGPFKVMVYTPHSKFIQVSQNGQRLKVFASYNTKEELVNRYYSDQRVIISCPNLKELNLDNHNLADNESRTGMKGDLRNSRENRLFGFSIDSLRLSVDEGSYFVMDSNRIGYLDAKVGMATNSSPLFYINETNKINAANLDIQNKTEFHFYSVIPGLKYSLSDSADLHTSGAVSNAMRR